MRAVSPGRAAVQDMDTDHARLYVAMAEKFLDRADIVAPSSGCVSDKWPLWVTSRLHGHCVDTSALRAEADVIGGKADVEIECLLSARERTFSRQAQKVRL